MQRACVHRAGSLDNKLPYDALGDFVGVTPLARQRPHEVLFGHAGYGSFIHLNTVLLHERIGKRFRDFGVRLD
jgi:hypothetical protein